MKNKLIIFGMIALLTGMVSCFLPTHDEPENNNKIDIKGSLTNGDMKNPNIEALWKEKTVYVMFYDDLGECVISISDAKEHCVFRDTVQTCSCDPVSFYMGDQPLGRYHLVISDGTDTAEGWFTHFRFFTIKSR